MPKPVCVKCQRFFTCVHTGFYFIEGMPEPGAEKGTATPELWKPYKIWSSDKWACSGCGAEILSGFGHAPVLVHHEPNFEHVVEQLNATQFQVNDC